MIPVYSLVRMSLFCLLMMFCVLPAYGQDEWIPIQENPMCVNGQCSTGPVRSVASASVQSAGRVIRYVGSTPRRVMTARPLQRIAKWRPFRSLSCCQ